LIGSLIRGFEYMRSNEQHETSLRLPNHYLLLENVEHFDLESKKETL